MADQELTHLDASGHAHMVDVGDKDADSSTSRGRGDRVDVRWTRSTSSSKAIYPKVMLWGLHAWQASWERRKPLTSFHCVIRLR